MDEIVENVDDETENDAEDVGENEQIVNEVNILNAFIAAIAQPEPSSSNVNNVNRTSENVPDDDNDSGPSCPKRKSRTTSNVAIEEMEDDDDGCTCPICFDLWEVSGDHRVAALKCGHLFGNSCIKRWLSECKTNALATCCPSCKSKAQPRDIRIIFVNKMRNVDPTEENRIRLILETEQQKSKDLANNVVTLNEEIKVASYEVQAMRNKIAGLSQLSASRSGPKTYKLALEKNIEVYKQPGCRVMVYGKRSKTLIISQASSLNLFPGFGVRFMSMNGFALTSFMHMSSTEIRDLSMDVSEELLVSATRDKTVKLYSIPSRTMLSAFTPSDKSIWSVAFDRSREKYLYLGSQQGSTYVYDIRSPQNYVEEHPANGDLSPVVSICPIPFNDDIPFGGFVVCKLRGLWFYEYTALQDVVCTKLDLDGPFVSVSYDDLTKHLLITARPNPGHPTMRYIIATVVKIEGSIILKTIQTITGSKTQTVMSRSAQMKVNGDIVVAAYLEDSKQLTTWNSQSGTKMQSLPISDVIRDACPLYINDKVYLSALSETRCRLYQINAQ